MYLYKGRLVNLRPASKNDYPTLYGWASNGESHHLAADPASSDFDRFVHAIGAQDVTIIESVGALRPIGYSVTYKVSPWDRSVHTSHYLAGGNRRRGHVIETAFFRGHYFFDAVGVRKVYVEVYENAQHVYDLLLHLGYVPEGFTPNHTVMGSQTVGLWTLALYRDAWEELVDGFSARLVSWLSKGTHSSPSQWFLSGGLAGGAWPAGQNDRQHLD